MIRRVLSGVALVAVVSLSGLAVHFSPHYAEERRLEAQEEICVDSGRMAARIRTNEVPKHLVVSGEIVTISGLEDRVVLCYSGAGWEVPK